MDDFSFIRKKALAEVNINRTQSFSFFSSTNLIFDNYCSHVELNPSRRSQLWRLSKIFSSIWIVEEEPVERSTCSRLQILNLSGFQILQLVKNRCSPWNVVLKIRIDSKIKHRKIYFVNVFFRYLSFSILCVSAFRLLC